MEVLVVEKVGQTITHEGDTVLVCKGDMPTDKVVLFLSKEAYQKVVSHFDVQVMT